MVKDKTIAFNISDEDRRLMLKEMKRLRFKNLNRLLIYIWDVYKRYEIDR